MVEPKKVIESAKLHPLGVVCHAFSPDRTMIAASIREENVVNIYKVEDLNTPHSWTLLHTLSEHSQMVSVVDWSAKNQILTGSHDRSVFVWSYEETRKQWVPSLVIINKQNRAILDGSWNSYGTKFLVGTGSYKAFLGYYNKEANWWDTFLLDKKKFGASVTSVAFHPSGFVAAVGSADYSIRIITTYLNEAGDNALSYKGPFSNVKSFGDELYRIKNAGSWVENLRWNDAGTLLAAAVHCSRIIFVQVEKDETLKESEALVDWDKAPFRSLLFLSDNTILAGGYDRVPYSFAGDCKSWSLQKTFSRDKKKDDGKRGSVVQSNLKIFEASKLGQGLAKEENEIHTNPIICMRTYKGTAGSIDTFSSNDIHGNIFFWKA